MLPAFRAVREQLDWDEMRAERRRTARSREAFLFLTDRLGHLGAQSA